MIKFPFLHELTKTEALALLLFASLGEASRYELFKEEETRQELKQKEEETRQELKQNEKHTSYSAFHSSVKSLLKHQLIEVTKTQPGKKNPQIKVEYYKLTLAGIIKVLLPLFDRYRWRVDAPEELYNYALELVGGLLANYPEMYPPEFYELSDRFRKEIALDYNVMYVTGEVWTISPFIRAYMEDDSDALTFYIELLSCKLGKLEEWKGALPPLLEYMTEKDVKIMVKLVERMMDYSEGLVKEAMEIIKPRREFLKTIKDLISQS